MSYTNYHVEYYYHMSALQLIRALCIDTDDDCEGDFYQCLMRILSLKLLIENHCFKLESLMTKRLPLYIRPLLLFPFENKHKFYVPQIFTEILSRHAGMNARPEN